MRLTTLAVLVAAAALGVVLLLFTDGGIGGPRRVDDERTLLGTSVSITVYARSTADAEEAIDKAFVRMAEIGAVASTANESSELSELNRLSYLPDVSDDLAQMLRLSLVVGRLSGGAFDATAGALLDLWHDSSTEGIAFSDLEPDVQSASIAAAKQHVGMNRIMLGSGRKTSVSLVPGTRVDLDGLILGTAVDAAILALHDTGIAHARVQAGQALRVYGGKPDGTPWEIELSDPSDPTRSVARFSMEHGAAATTGTPARFFDSTVDPAWILDPRTGYPATAASSATILASTCAEADALAAAAFVLGPKSGMALIEGLANTEGLILNFDNPQEAHRSAGLAIFEAPTPD